MKRYSRIAAGLLALTLLPALPQTAFHGESRSIITAHAEDLNYEDMFTYVIEEDHVCVTDFLAEEVDIPDTIGGLPVTELASCYSEGATVHPRSVRLPSTLKRIGGYLLTNCPELTELTLPASVESVDGFYNDTALEAINVEPENTHYRSIDGVLYRLYENEGTEKMELLLYPSGKKDSTYIMPQNVSGDGFSPNPYLKEITFSEQYANTYCAFTGMSSLEAIHVPEENQFLREQDGVLFDKSGKLLICYPQAKPERSYTVPEGVAEISNHAFAGQQHLEQIILPSSLTLIKYNAFQNASELVAITFNTAMSVESLSIESAVFEGTPYLEHLEPQNGLYITPEGILLRAEDCADDLVLPPEVRIIAGGVFGSDSENQVQSVTIQSPCTLCSGAFSNYDGTVSFQAPVRLCRNALYRLNFKELQFEDDCTLESGAIFSCEALQKIDFRGKATFSEDGTAISYCPVLKGILFHEDAVIEGGIASDCDTNLQVTAEKDCALGADPFSYGLVYDEKIGSWVETAYTAKLHVLGDLRVIGKIQKLYQDVEFTRKPLAYSLFDPDCKPLTAQSHTQTFPDCSANTVRSYWHVVNSGYGTDNIQEIEHPDGTLYAVMRAENGAIVAAEDGSREPLTIMNEEFRLGAAGFDDQGRVFILWGKTISQEAVDANPEQENLVLIRYDMQGNETGRCGIPIKLLGTRVPFAGNAQVGYHDGQVLCLFNTEWCFPGNDRFKGHQGMEYFAVNADTMELTNSSDWEGSHSFGISETETEYGYVAIQLGDAGERGVVVTTYHLAPDGTEGNYIGRTVAFHSSGQYGTNEHQLDGNATYTHLGGIAKSRSTYAIVGKSERFYSSAVYKGSDSLPKGNFDVFVRILDQSLADGASDLAGEERTDLETGEVVDRNIVWLTDTEHHPGEKCGDVKIVTLSDGSYCVLWERFLTSETNSEGAFDSVRMVILDECGNILQGETEIQGARLSYSSIMPIVQGNTLHWATASTTYDYTKEPTESNCELTWYSLTLANGTTPVVHDSTLLGDVNLDGTVNATDAAEILIVAAKNGAGEDSGLSAQQKQNADVNSDSEINAGDAAAVLMYAAVVGAGEADAKIEDFV